MKLVLVLVVLVVLQSGCLAQRPPRARGPCFQAYRELWIRLQANPGLVGWEWPRCNRAGYYLGMQYGGSKAFCVTLTGTRIPNFEVDRWATGSNMHCRCARAWYAYSLTGLIGRTFRCTSNGNYDPIGCTGSRCYCQNQFGQQISRSVPIEEMNSLNC